ncbi:MAG TPA: hypothetical protein VLE54_07475 [Thermoanaerobaculia bacterium]|nr:hypothetical protein [Thermoanaerobaculia bacterium]
MGRLRSPHLCIAVVAAGLALAATSSAQGVRVSAGTIEDRRTTGKFFAGLEIELKLTGDDLADAKSARILLKKAVDETGRNILPESKPDEEFKSINSSELKLSLKNPARGASAVKEIAGEIQLFVPSRDPAAVVTVDRLLSRMDKAIDSPALKAQKIAIRVVSPSAHRAAAKKREAELEKEMEKHKDEMKKEAGDDKTAEALMALVKGFSGMMNEVGDNDLILEIEDEQKKLLDVSVVGPKGDTIDTRGSMSSGSLRILQFGEKLPADAKLRLLLQTPKAIVSAPFSLTNVPLP